MSQKIQAYVRGEVERIKKVQARNWTTFKRQPWQEMSGAFGDLGTFVPIFIALAVGGSGYGSIHGHRDGIAISVSSTLVLSGLANIVTGAYFGIPLPVQPMKAIAAVAIANNAFGTAQLMSAGLFVAACVGFLSLTGLLQVFTKAVPTPVVKGIQMGAGLTLAMKGVPMLYPDTHVGTTIDYFLTAVVIVAAILAITVMLTVTTFERVPFTLFVVGAMAALLSVYGIVQLITEPHPYEPVTFSLWDPSKLVFVPGWHDFVEGAFRAGLGQLPLTTLNSIVAVVYLAEDLFPNLEAPTATAIGTSVTLMNLVGCWFQAMPVCHGSGGLAAQYKFGARSGASVIFLGLLKLVFGLFASQLAFFFCAAFPPYLLGFLLIVAGLELVRMGESINGEAARDLWLEIDHDEEEGEAEGEGEGEGGRERHEAVAGENHHDRSVTRRVTKRFNTPTEQVKTRRWNVMAATVTGLLGAKNDGIGFIAGMSMHGAYNLHDWWVKRAAAHEGQIRLPDSRREHGEDDDDF